MDRSDQPTADWMPPFARGSDASDVADSLPPAEVAGKTTEPSGASDGLVEDRDGTDQDPVAPPSSPPAQTEAPISEGVESGAVDEAEVAEADAGLDPGDLTRWQPLMELLADLDRRLDEALRIAKHKDDVIDRMHSENQALRAGELQRAQMPLLRDLMRLYDDLDRIAGGGTATVADVEFAREILADTLSRNGVDRFAPAVGEVFDSAVHAAVEVVSVEDSAEDRTIARVRRCGFRKDDGVILRASDVAVRRASTAPPASSETSDSDG